MMSKKEATTSSTVVSGTLFINSKPFCVLFDSSADSFFYIYMICYTIEPGEQEDGN